MTASGEERDQLFKNFARAFFKRDADALYEFVTPDFEWHTLNADGARHVVTGQSNVAEQLRQRSDKLTNIRFEDVVYHHAPDATFMTFRITATDSETGRPHEEVGVERYTFRDGRIAIKDVYRK